MIKNYSVLIVASNFWSSKPCKKSANNVDRGRDWNTFFPLLTVLISPSGSKSKAQDLYGRFQKESHYFSSYLFFVILIVGRFLKTLSVLTFPSLQTQISRWIQVFFFPQCINQELFCRRRLASKSGPLWLRFWFLIVWKRSPKFLIILNLLDNQTLFSRHPCTWFLPWRLMLTNYTGVSQWEFVFSVAWVGYMIVDNFLKTLAFSISLNLQTQISN